MTLYLIRGLPGSGKSTRAKQMNCFHVEADMFFVRNGKYVFIPHLLPKAHLWCQDKAREAISSGFDVAVSNTFTTNWEMRPYFTMAKETNTAVHVIECVGDFGSVHEIPERTITSMKNRWEQCDV